MKQFCKEGRTVLKEMGGFLWRQRYLAVFTLLVTICSHGALLLYSSDIGTDTEAYVVRLKDTFDTFMQVGRFGIVLTKKLFFTNGYTPFLFGIYTIFAMCLTCLLFDFCIVRILGRRNGRGLLFCYVFNALYVSGPVLTQQFYFRYQAFEVSMAFSFCILAAFFAFLTIYEGKSRWWLIASLVFMIWGFSTYQVLVPYYLAVNGSLFVLAYLYQDKPEHKSWLRICMGFVVLFLAGLLGHLAVSKLLIWCIYGVTEVPHLNDTYSCWGKLEPYQCFDSIRGDLKRVLKPELLLFSRLYGPALVLFFAGMCIQGWRKRKGGYGFFLFAVIFTGFSPFLMSLVLGNYQIVRAQMVYPFILGFCCAVVVALLWGKRFITLVFAGIMTLFTINQIKISNLYYQLAHQTAVEDASFARGIYGETLNLRPHSQMDSIPIVFAGRREAVRASSSVNPWDAFGLSFFEIDHDTIHGSIRIARLMACLGLETAEPEPTQYEYGLEAAKGMESWPQKGSVRYENGIIIVKLSE